jgi:ferric-dicitrate binding protein FerR (iron transport regulator)
LAALLVLILGVFAVAQSGGAVATLVVSSGDVVVNQARGVVFAGSAETAVSAGNVLAVQEGDTIRLAENASAQLKLQDGSTVDLFSDTTLSVTELVTSDESFRVQLTLFSGKTLNRVVRLLRSDDAFEIKTPSSTASVRGTVFTVEAQTAEISHVAVEEGVVRVTMADQWVDVEPGFQVTAVLGQELKVVPLDAPTADPTATPTNTATDTPEATEESTETSTAVPTEDDTKSDSTSSEPPDTIPAKTPDEVPGEDDPPVSDGTPSGPIDPDDSGSEKVLICHYPSGDVTKGNTLEIDASAVDAHLAHGDQLGSCPPAPAPTNTPVPQPTNTLVPAPTNTPVPAPTNTPVPAPTNTPVPAPTNTPVPAPTNTPDAGGKVTVCHNGNTIEVNANAVAAHLAHGDQLGACP